MTLTEYLRSDQSRQSDLAAKVGVTPQMISHLVVGRRKPSSELARKIELATEGAVTLRDWYPEVTIATPETPEEQAHG